MNAAKTYKFLLKYPAVPSSKELARLERKVATSFTRQKYQEYLSKYNIFCLFAWKHNHREIGDGSNDDSTIIDKRHYWRMFNRSTMGRDLQGLALSQRQQEQQYSSIALKEPLDIKVFEECISLNFIGDPTTQLQCKLTRTNHLEAIERALKRVDADPASQLEVFSLGIRLDAQNEELDYIQPLLEQSHSMYKELNYDKLVQFAKWERTDGQSPKSQIAKSFLHKLAKSNLSVPLLSVDGNWLVFKRN